MKNSKKYLVSRVGALFAALVAVAMATAVPTAVIAEGGDQVDVPTVEVGSSAYFGNIIDIEEALLSGDVEDGLADLEDMGFTVDYDVAGNMGTYFGVEVVSDSEEVGGETCYDYEIMGGYGLNVSANGSVDGSMEMYETSIDMYGSADIVAQVEVSVRGHAYFTVDKLALAKVDLTVTADASAEFDFEYEMAYTGYYPSSQEMSGDGTYEVDGAQIDLEMTFDPPVDLYQFPIFEDEEWYVPKVDTEVSGAIEAEGTVTYDVSYSMTGEDPYQEDDTVDLDDEVGDSDFYDVIPGGEPGFDMETYEYSGGTLFSCTAIDGDDVIIEMDMSGMLIPGIEMPLSGAKQSLTDPTSMLPSMGFQMNSESGLVTGMTMNGEAMTEEATEAEVEDFTEQPLAATTGEIELGAGDEADSDSPIPGSMLAIIVVAVIAVVIVVVVVVVLMRKKNPPSHTPVQPAYQSPQQPGAASGQYPPQNPQPPQGQTPPTQ